MRTYMAVCSLAFACTVCGCGGTGDVQPRAVQPSSARETQAASRQEEEYETPLGKLRRSSGITIEKGAQVSLGMGKLDIIFGFTRIERGVGLKVSPSFGVYRGQVSGEAPNITLVQVKSTGEWLATDGRLGIQQDKFVFVEGHTVKIIGGSRNSIVIGGQSFADTVVTIRNGVPSQ